MSDLSDLKEKLNSITETEWEAYVKVRDILAAGSDLLLGGGAGATEAAGATAFFGKVVRCAMLGVFEPAVGAGAIGGYDEGAVRRFADLGG